MKRKAMKILALDTALNACSVAIVSGTDLLAHTHEERARGHAEKLIPTIKTLMHKTEMSFEELDLIAVSVGPGTFTGLRIGLAAARGISLASTTPCVGVTTLETLAASVSPEKADGRPIVVAIDARRKEVYLQIFAYDGAQEFPSPLSEAKAVPIEETAEFLPTSSFVILGSGAELLQNSTGFNKTLSEQLDHDPNPDARIIAAIGLAKGRPAEGSPPPAPVYLRSPDAKLPGGKDLKIAITHDR